MHDGGRLHSRKTVVGNVQNTMQKHQDRAQNESHTREVWLQFVMHPEMHGSPDLAIPNSKIAIFCDGDF